LIDYHVIQTGSLGNAVLIEQNILIDAGVSFVKIEPYFKDIKLVLLSHVHSDHFKPSTIRRMAHDKPLLRFGCGAWMVKPLVDSGVAKSQIDVLKENVAYNYGICNVIPIETVHDVRNYAYKLHFPHGKVFYATDLGTLSGITARNYSLYLLESNYNEEELRTRMDEKIANGQYAYERRVLRYHLSDKQANNWLYSQMGPNSEYVYLHQHIDREPQWGRASDEEMGEET